MAALGFEPPPLGREPCAIPLNQCIVFTIITKLNDDFVCKKNKHSRHNGRFKSGCNAIGPYFEFAFKLACGNRNEVCVRRKIHGDVPIAALLNGLYHPNFNLIHLPTFGNFIINALIGYVPITALLNGLYHPNFKLGSGTSEEFIYTTKFNHK